MSGVCKGNEGRLVSLMSGSLSAKAADDLRRHLESCAGCAEGWARLQQTAELCRSLGEEPAPNLPWRKIEAQIQWRLTRPEEERRSRAWRWLPPLGLAAAVSAAVVAGLIFFRPTPPTRPSAQVVRSSVPQKAVEDEELAAVVTMAQGEVSVVSSKGRASALSLSRPVLQGDRVLTADGQLALQWAPSTGILLSRGSEAELYRLRSMDQEIHLWQGRVLAKVQKQRQGQVFAVLAGGIRVSVRGTLFSVGITDKEVEVEVHEGLVRVEPDNRAWPAVEIPAGLSVRAPLESRLRPMLTRVSKKVSASQLNLLPWSSFEKVMTGTGILAVESQPEGADLSVDSRELGTTNLSLRAPLGRHLIELRRDGRLVRSEWVEVDGAPGSLSLDLSVRPTPASRPQLLPSRFQDVFREREPQIRGCYERWLKTDPSLEGKLTLRVEVDEQGRVARASLDVDTLSERRVGQCALAAVQRWRFPAGSPAELVYPFQFRPH